VTDFTLFGALAFGTFCLAWLLYQNFFEHPRAGEQSLNGLMDRYRARWVKQMEQRAERIFDTQVLAGLQNGTAFFASTSIFAFGGAFALIRTADDVLKIFSDLPLGIMTTRTMWEIKVSGLALIFVYAFFKFAWSYRLFNYAAILLGAAPTADRGSPLDRSQHAEALTAVITDAGREFNRGQRAFFFTLSYVGYFVSPVALIITCLRRLLRCYNDNFDHARMRQSKRLPLMMKHIRRA